MLSDLPSNQPIILYHKTFWSTDISAAGVTHTWLRAPASSPAPYPPRGAASRSPVLPLRENPLRPPRRPPWRRPVRWEPPWDPKPSAATPAIKAAARDTNKNTGEKQGLLFCVNLNLKTFESSLILGKPIWLFDPFKIELAQQGIFRWFVQNYHL